MGEIEHITHGAVLALATEYGKRLCDVFASVTTVHTKAAADAEVELERGIQEYAEGWAAEMTAERDAARRELAEAVEPCGTCSHPWVEHDGTERYCPYSKRDEAINGSTHYCAKSLWESVNREDDLTRELAAAREALPSATTGIDVRILPRTNNVLSWNLRLCDDCTLELIEAGFAVKRTEPRAALGEEVQPA